MKEVSKLFNFSYIDLSFRSVSSSSFRRPLLFAVLNTDKNRIEFRHEWFDNWPKIIEWIFQQWQQQKRRIQFKITNLFHFIISNSIKVKIKEKYRFVFFLLQSSSTQIGFYVCPKCKRYKIWRKERKKRVRRHSVFKYFFSHSILFVFRDIFI